MIIPSSTSFIHKTIQITESVHKRCWIPSIEGTNFEIWWKSPADVEPGLDLRCSPRLDGIQVRRKILGAWSIAEGESGKHNGQTTSDSTFRLYSFGKRELTGTLCGSVILSPNSPCCIADKEDIAPLVEDVKEQLNTIHILLSWGHSSNSRPRRTFELPKETRLIHEKAAKKGHAGSVGLGDTISIDYPSTQCDFTPEPRLEPLVFIFHYASLGEQRCSKYFQLLNKTPQTGSKHGELPRL
jgi:hypothetical protein